MAGSRTLTGTASTALADTTRVAFDIVKIEWSSGTVHYSDCARTVDSVSCQGRVTRWGDPLSTLDATNTWDFDLEDTDGAIRGLIASDGLVNVVVTLYQAWTGAATEDWVVKWKGVTDDQSVWDESNPIVTITSQGYDKKLSGPACVVVDADLFPYAAEESRDQALPIIYGKRRAVKALCMKGGGPTTLTTTSLLDDGQYSSGDGPIDYFYVEDATDFPASAVDNQIEVWIGLERVLGYFGTGDDASKFTVTQRHLVEHSGTLNFTTEDHPNKYLKLKLDTTEDDDYWNGYAIRFKIYDDSIPYEQTGPWQHRVITKYWKDGADAYCYIANPFSADEPWITDDTLQGWGFNLWAPTGYETTNMDYEIVTPTATWVSGSAVRYACASGGDHSVVYGVCDSTASEISGVYVSVGEKKDDEPPPRLYLPTGTYTVNTNDSQFSSELGRNITTLTFNCPPRNLQWAGEMRTLMTMGGRPISWVIPQYRGQDDIYVNVEGPTDGDLIDNPADIIDHLAQAYGLTGGEIDSAAITSVGTARSAWRMAFAHADTSARQYEVLNQLAEQAFCAIDWTEGKLRLIALSNTPNSDAKAATITNATRVADTVFAHRIQRTGRVAAVTRVVGTYKDADGNDKRVPQTDTALSASNLSTHDIDCWAYAHRNPTKACANYWLYRKRYTPHQYEVGVMLDNLSLVPGDVVTVLGADGWIEEVTPHPGAVNDPDYVLLRVAVPPADWYDAGWSYPSPAYTDPPDTSDETLYIAIGPQPPAPNTTPMNTTPVTNTGETPTPGATTTYGDTPTPNATYTVADTPTPGATYTPEDTPTAGATTTPGDTPTAGETTTPADTPTPGGTPTPGDTPTPGATYTPGDTPTAAATMTPGDTPTGGATTTPGDTPTPAATTTPGDTPPPGATTTPGDTPTAGATPTPGDTPTAGETYTPGDTPTAGATYTPGDTPTDGATPTDGTTPTDGATPTPVTGSCNNCASPPESVTVTIVGGDCEGVYVCSRIDNESGTDNCQYQGSSGGITATVTFTQLEEYYYWSISFSGCEYLGVADCETSSCTSGASCSGNGVSTTYTI